MNKNFAFILLGTNIGEREFHLEKATKLVNERVGVISEKSKIYQTEPWGETNQPVFLNQVLKIIPNHSPQITLSNCLNIEKDMGRERKKHWGERNIDIDILFYNTLIINDLNLIVPHPRLHLRNFTLVPLEEIAPKFRHPILKKTMFELLELCSDDLNVFEF